MLLRPVWLVLSLQANNAVYLSVTYKVFFFLVYNKLQAAFTFWIISFGKSWNWNNRNMVKQTVYNIMDYGFSSFK